MEKTFFMFKPYQRKMRITSRSDLDELLHIKIAYAKGKSPERTKKN